MIRQEANRKINSTQHLCHNIRIMALLALLSCSEFLLFYSIFLQMIIPDHPRQMIIPRHWGLCSHQIWSTGVHSNLSDILYLIKYIYKY